MTDAKDAAREVLAREKEASDKAKAEYAERTKGKPTPTQEECDLAVLGAPSTEHEDDGSGPDPYARKDVEAKKPSGSGYQTRQAGASQSRQTTHTPPHRSE